MKLLAAKTATTATELSLGKATCVAVYASAISIISVVENDGTEGGTSGTVQGSVTVPAASLTVFGGRCCRPIKVSCKKEKGSRY